VEAGYFSLHASAEFIGIGCELEMGKRTAILVARILSFGGVEVRKMRWDDRMGWIC
jgi:hypothetical protein